MSVNLLDLVQGQLTGPMKSKLGSLLGVDDDAAAKAIDGATPSLLAGLMKQGSTGPGANALSASLDKFDTGILDGLGSMLGGGKEGGLMDMGGGLLKGLFGGSLGSITELISKATGLAGGKMGSLLKMLAPVVFGVLAKQKNLLGLGASGLGKLLLNQAGFLKGKLPAGLADSLGINNLLSPAPAAATAPEAPASGGSLLGKLIPLALVLGLGYFAYTKFFAGGDEGSTVSAAAAPVQDKLEEVFGSVTGSLEKVTDEASAKQAVPQLEAATQSLGGIGTSLDALPAAAQGPIRSLVSTFLPKLQGAIDGVMKLGGGMQDILGPVTAGLLEKLKGLAQ